MSLLFSLTSRGVRLSARDGRLRVDFPRGVLTAEDVAELTKHKHEILAALESAARWRCEGWLCRNKTGWWMSPWGVVRCKDCVPPSFPGLVVAEFDAPGRTKAARVEAPVRAEVEAAAAADGPTVPVRLDGAVGVDVTDEP
jgi:hypothetical protein